jgi:hypothetical protein
MNRIPLACTCLIASAVVLSGLLIVQLSGELGPTPARAEMVIARENFTLLTAQTRDGEEALFVLDNTTGTLLVYRLDIGRDQMIPAGGLRLDEIFADGGERGNDRRRGR